LDQAVETGRRKDAENVALREKIAALELELLRKQGARQAGEAAVAAATAVPSKRKFKFAGIQQHCAGENAGGCLN
jgi:hypothetical protein